VVLNDLPGACLSGSVCCGGGCTPLGTDTDCGACADACLGPGETCGGGGTAGICGCSDDGEACADNVCGTATNNCEATVFCGPLGGACPQEPGQTCQAGQCVCDETSCPSGCCDDADLCHIDEDAACGTKGGECTACEGTGVTCGGGGQAGVCGCSRTTTCTPEQCGTTITDNCGQPLDCPDCTLSFATVGSHNWTVPANVFGARFDVYGAQGGTFAEGGAAGGQGGRAAGTVGVIGGETLTVIVGQRGGDSVYAGDDATENPGGAGGAPNGGAGGTSGSRHVGGGGGGGSSEVRRGGARLVVGGGGGGGQNRNRGGHGGGASGDHGGGDFTGDGAGNIVRVGGFGATPSGPGAGGTFCNAHGQPGTTAGQGGVGGSALTDHSGGGGGGGYFGGGGGCAGEGGGGGGNGFVDPTATDPIQAVGGQTGDGLVTITYRFG
jgi:hypothetical protein